MKLQNESAANSKVSVRDCGILIVGADGIIEVSDKDVAARLVSVGWKLVKSAKPKKEEPKKEEPKKEEPKVEAKVEAKKAPKKKKSAIPDRERPSFKRKSAE